MVRTYSQQAQFVAINGSPQHLGVITATTTKNNHDTAVPFNNTGAGLGGKNLLLQPDTACYVRGVTTNAGTVTTANGLYIEARAVYQCTLLNNEGWIACVAVSGTTVLHVMEML